MEQLEATGPYRIGWRVHVIARLDKVYRVNKTYYFLFTYKCRILIDLKSIHSKSLLFIC